MRLLLSCLISDVAKLLMKLSMKLDGAQGLCLYVYRDGVDKNAEWYKEWEFRCKEFNKLAKGTDNE